MRDFIVIGLGRFGASVAKNLHRFGKNVLGVDPDEEAVNACLPYLGKGIVADASVETTLRHLGVANYDVAVVGIGSDVGKSILVTMLLKELGVGLVVARASDEVHARCLQKVGADRVILAERDMGVRVARNAADASLIDFIELDPQISIVEVAVGRELVGKSLLDLDLTGRYGANIIALKRDEDILVGPKPEEVMRSGDIMIAVGRNGRMTQFLKHQQ